MRYLIVALTMAVVLSAFTLPSAKRADRISTISNTLTSSIQDYHDRIYADADSLALEFTDYAKTLMGTPYVWGSTNPKVGVDCSGFVNYVSNHFGIKVPRTSAQFTNLGVEIDADRARTGDIILFTGSNAKKRIVGHMGIVTGNNDSTLQFIHSSSGGRKGVHVSELKGYYKTRLVKIIRIFPLADNKIVV